MKKKFVMNLLVTGLMLASITPVISAAGNGTSSKLEPSSQTVEQAVTFKASDIRYLITLPEGKEEAKAKAEIEHNDAIQLVAESMKKNGVAIKYLDSEKFLSKY